MQTPFSPGCVNDTDLGDVFLIYARTGGPGAKGLSLFLVEKEMEGFSLGQRIKDKCGMRASPTAVLHFDDVVIPAENLVGEEASACHAGPSVAVSPAAVLPCRPPPCRLAARRHVALPPAARRLPPYLAGWPPSCSGSAWFH